MNNFNEERSVLELAKPLLKEIYGDFEVDPDQWDRPDAAIILRGSDDNLQGATRRKIGIEITTVDKHENMQYLNDEKFQKNLLISQVKSLMEGKAADKRPNKKISINFPNSYISDGAAKKTTKYQEYNSTGNFDELIVLVFSNYFDLNNFNLRKYHAVWCSHHLSVAGFPFDKVIFVSTSSAGEAIVVYDKRKPNFNIPKQDKGKEVGKEIMRTPILKIGEKYNLNNLFSQNPVLKPKGKK